MRVVSTVHKAGFDVYGQKWVDGVGRWPAGTEFLLYTEGFDLEHPRIKTKRIESMPRAEAFKESYAHYKPVLWRWDIVKWCNKVFAAYDALYDYDGLGVWLDCDASTHTQIPDGYIEKLLKPGDYWTGFKRVGMQTETGFWLMDCRHPQHRRFMDQWVKWLESGAFKGLEQWCDASTLDATLRAFERSGLITTASLSGPHEREMHPWALSEFANYINHAKGALKYAE